MKKIDFFFVGLILVCEILNSQENNKITYIHSQPAIEVCDLLKIRKDIQYIKVSDAFQLERERTPLPKDTTWWVQEPILFPERFILSIPHGRVYSQQGFVVVDDLYVSEFVWEPIKVEGVIPLKKIATFGKPRTINGRVAVVTQGGSWNYYHWMVEVLPKLLMLQESKIPYDYLYLPNDRPYMKDTIDLLGIDTRKIIQPTGENKYIQADELIVISPSSAYGYTDQYIIEFLRNTFIPLACKFIDPAAFSKRVFISRRTASCRKIQNEDDVFAFFKKYGFVRYDLEEYSFLEQVMLFYNAEIIVGEHGAGLTNMMFAEPGTDVVEIFQARARAMYWYLSQELGLHYHYIKTMSFHDKGNFHSVVPLEPVKKFVEQLFN